MKNYTEKRYDGRGFHIVFVGFSISEMVKVGMRWSGEEGSICLERRYKRRVGYISHSCLQPFFIFLNARVGYIVVGFLCDNSFHRS